MLRLLLCAGLAVTAIAALASAIYMNLSLLFVNGYLQPSEAALLGISASVLCGMVWALGKNG